MIIPIWYFLGLYLVMLGLASLFFLFNFFHIAKFGIGTIRSTCVIILYTISFGAMTIITSDFLLQFDWTQTIEIGSMFNTIPSI